MARLISLSIGILTFILLWPGRAQRGMGPNLLQSQTEIYEAFEAARRPGGACGGRLSAAGEKEKTGGDYADSGAAEGSSGDRDRRALATCVSRFTAERERVALSTGARRPEGSAQELGRADPRQTARVCRQYRRSAP